MRVLIRQVRGRAKHPNWVGIADEVGKAVDSEVKPKLKQRFEAVVADWEHKPGFGTRKRISRKEIVIFVFPKGKHKKIWGYVSRGTKPHRIPKSGQTLLAFPTGYTPKTKPKGKFGGPGTYKGPMVFAMYVEEHPGTDPRLFEETIAEDELPEFRRTVENAMRRGARKA